MSRPISITREPSNGSTAGRVRSTARKSSTACSGVDRSASKNPITEDAESAASMPARTASPLPRLIDCRTSSLTPAPRRESDRGSQRCHRRSRRPPAPSARLDASSRNGRTPRVEASRLVVAGHHQDQFRRHGTRSARKRSQSRSICTARSSSGLSPKYSVTYPIAERLLEPRSVVERRDDDRCLQRQHVAGSRPVADVRHGLEYHGSGHCSDAGAITDTCIRAIRMDRGRSRMRRRGTASGRSARRCGLRGSAA